MLAAAPPPAAGSFLRPWSAGTVGQASKKELVSWLQTSCSDAFLQQHKLNGNTAAVAKSRSASQLRTCYAAACECA
eukprot:SAG22_NODE_14533_length_372_cov_0.794872_1_plen_75_part_01